MKNLIALGIVGLLVAPVMAGTSLNPDRRPSLGIDVSDTFVGETLGTSQLYDQKENVTTYFHPRSELHVQQMIIDARVPITNDWTFSIHGGPNKSDFFGESHSGYSVGGGFRYYLPEMK